MTTANQSDSNGTFHLDILSISMSKLSIPNCKKVESLGVDHFKPVHFLTKSFIAGFHKGIVSWLGTAYLEKKKDLARRNQIKK